MIVIRGVVGFLAAGWDRAKASAASFLGRLTSRRPMYAWLGLISTQGESAGIRDAAVFRRVYVSGLVSQVTQHPTAYRFFLSLESSPFHSY